VYWQVVFPQNNMFAQDLLEGKPSARITTTTISHTFAEYNTFITIYIVGPLSLLFLFRVNRTLQDGNLSQFYKKIIFLVLICVQYTTFVVVRFDSIKGAAHYLFTALTFICVLVYHATVTSSYDLRHRDRLIVINFSKCCIAACSLSAMCGFATIILICENVRSRVQLWTFACCLEILAILLLGSLDMMDIYTLGRSL